MVSLWCLMECQAVLVLVHSTSTYSVSVYIEKTATGRPKKTRSAWYHYCCSCVVTFTLAIVAEQCSTHLTVEELDTNLHSKCQFVTERCACGTEILRQHPDLNMSDVTNPCHTIQMANGQFVLSHGVPGRTRTCTQYFDLLSVSIHWRNCNWSTEKHSVCLITLLLFLCCNRYTSHCVSTIIIPSQITDRNATILLLSYYLEGKNCTCNQNIASGNLSWDITDPKTNDNNLTIYLCMPIHCKFQRW